MEHFPVGRAASDLVDHGVEVGSHSLKMLPFHSEELERLHIPPQANQLATDHVVKNLAKNLELRFGNGFFLYEKIRIRILFCKKAIRR